jgi:hypothetical protein
MAKKAGPTKTIPVFIGLNTPIAGLEGYTKTYRLPHSGLVQAILSEIVMALLCGNSRAKQLISPIHNFTAGL